MDARIYDLFMKENDAWNDMITRQRREIPTLEKMLSEIMLEKRTVGDDTLANVRQLQHEMHTQEINMDEVRSELENQQKILATERKANGDPYAINTLFSQNILREKIKGVEKTFLELKCNYLNYVATVVW